jgi:hypothetical protein
MGKFVTTQVPAWRIWLWGVVGALAVCGLGYFSAGYFDWRILIPATFVGLLFPGFGFFLLSSSRSRFAARHARTLLVIYIVAQSTLLVWTILSRQK